MCKSNRFVLIVSFFLYLIKTYQLLFKFVQYSMLLEDKNNYFSWSRTLYFGRTYNSYCSSHLAEENALYEIRSVSSHFIFARKRATAGKENDRHRGQLENSSWNIASFWYHERTLTHVSQINARAKSTIRHVLVYRWINIFLENVELRTC